MAKKKALITGITGQDGSYLAEYLLDLGYEVHGIIRRVALEDQKHRMWRINSIRDKVTLYCGSLESYPSIFKIMTDVQPDECYHLAAQSFVSYSFEDEFSTFNTNINGTHFVLSSIKNAAPDCRLYFAASSEMFGKVEKVPQNENTRFHPRSVYGISKVAEDPSISLNQLIQSTIDLIPYSLQYPDIACAKVVFGDQVFSTGDFSKTKSAVTSDIVVYGEPAGTLNVWYFEDIAELDEIPFLKEEQELIGALSEQLARFIEQRQAEEALIDSEERFRQMSELSPFPVWIRLPDGQTEYINPQFTKLFGYTVEDMPLCNALPGFMRLFKENDSSTDDVSHTLPDDIGITKKEFKLTCKDGGIKIVSVRSLPMDNDKTYMVFHDITESKRIEQMKTDFVSMVSHQLKTPVGVIRGYIDNMLSGLTGDLTEKQIQYLKDMEDISTKNYNLVSDLLNVSRIERGVIFVDFESVNLEVIIDRVTSEYLASIQEKGLKLLVEYEKENIEVLSDKDKMIEALCNIINNAVKFTSDGHIRIQAKCDDDYAFINVSDTGIGMSGDILAKLFSKNQILSGSPTPDGGSGLGLYIAKEFMELQHGDISATSIEGQGSNFLFKIPLSKNNSQIGGATW